MTNDGQQTAPTGRETRSALGERATRTGQHAYTDAHSEPQLGRKFGMGIKVRFEAKAGIEIGRLRIGKQYNFIDPRDQECGPKAIRHLAVFACGLRLGQMSGLSLLKRP